MSNEKIIHSVKNVKLLKSIDFLDELPFNLIKSSLEYNTSTKDSTVTEINNRLFTLEKLILPLKEDIFLKEYWSEKFLYLSKAVKNTSELFSWSKVNDILSLHTFTFPKFRLIDSTGINLNQNNYSTQKFTVSAINAELKKGANLIINGVQELDIGLREVCNELSKTFKNYTSVNAYIAFKHVGGFPIHWDDHETLIVQIDGKKYWKVYEPTRVHPLRNDIEGNTALPDSEPLFEGVLEPGDVLYLPRGFWHLVTPVNEPSLHLTFSIEPTIGYNWFQSIIIRTLKEVSVRKNIPIFSSEDELYALQKELKNLLVNEIEQADIIHFMNLHESTFKQNVKFSLPESVAHNKFINETAVRFSGIVRIIEDKYNDSDFELITMKRKLLISKQVKKSIKKLLVSQSIKVSELVANYEGDEFNQDEVIHFYQQLLFEGIIEVVK